MEGDVYEVGKLFDPGRTTWPEAVRYIYHDGQHALVLIRRRPRLAEIEALTEGPAELALYVEGDLLLLLYRFHSPELDPVIDWSDAPFTIHRVPEAGKRLPSDTPSRAELQVFVVDAENGVLLGKRALSLDEQFTASLYRAIREQAERPWSSTDYDRALRQLYSRHRTGELARLAQYRTRAM